MRKTLVNLRFRLAIAVLGLLAILTFDAAAQSGRRSTKQEPPPAPVQTAPAEPAPPRRPASQPAAPTMPLILGFNRMSSSFEMTPTYVQEYVYEACVSRLRKSGAIALSPAGDMSRKEAVDRAKLQKEAYVVWFEVATDSYGRGATDASLRGDSRLFIDYYIFTPGTAKVKKFGRVYLDQLRAGQGRVGVSIPSVTGRLPIQYRLQIAGEEVADRVLNEFHIPLPN